MLGGVGLHFGAVQGRMPQLHQPGPLTQLQHLHKQVPQGRQMLPARVGEREEVGRLVGHQHPKADVLLQMLGQTPDRGDAHAVSVQEYLDHQAGMVGRASSPFLLIAGPDRSQVQPVHHSRHEIRKMVVRQPFLRRGRQQQRLAGTVDPVRLAHLHLLDTAAILPEMNLARLTYADSLPVHLFTGLNSGRRLSPLKGLLEPQRALVPGQPA